MPGATSSLRSKVALAALLGAACGAANHAQAQVVSRPVVQAVPDTASQALNSALARIARDPRDAAALLDAGTAALAMGDAEAAIGFFTRAEQVEPGSARAKAGLAGAHVRNEDPFTAIRLFQEAEQAGPLSAALLADRGLAYDLVGDNGTAQRYYRQAGPTNDEALRRLSLSLAISGDKRGSESALAPLVARQDRSAWRTRAFALAILGETTQAVAIANAMMPAGMAAAISPYLRYMRQLTPAQQAAAANLGHFPRASEIGRDDPRIAQYARPAARPAPAGPDAGLVPAGEPLGARSREAPRLARQDRERDRKGGRERERPPEPIVGVMTSSPVALSATTATVPPQPSSARPALATVSTSEGVTVAPVTRPTAASAQTNSPAPAAAAKVAAAPTTSTAAVARPLVGPPAPPPAGAGPPAPGPSFTLLPAATASARSAAKVAAAADAPNSGAAATSLGAAVPPAARPIRLVDAFSEFGRPTVDAAPAPGAVDVRKLAADRRPEASKPAKPAAPPQPSRIWVQVATGRDKQALGSDWRKFARDDAAVFRGKKPYVAAWGQTNRLLTGPFDTEAAANAFVAQLRRANVEGAFLWTSPAGQVVDALAGVKSVEVSRSEAEPAATRRNRARAEPKPVDARSRSDAEPAAARRNRARAEPKPAETRRSTGRTEPEPSAKRRGRPAEEEPASTRRSKARR